MEPSAFIQYDEKTKYAGKRTLATKQTSKQNTNLTEEYLIFEKTEEHVDQLSIVTMIEREETEAERQFRVGQEQVQQQQTKKKQEKKQEEIVFLMVKEIKNSNLTITRTMPSFSRWLASQLQVIQDRKFFVKLDENQPTIRQNCLYIYDRIYPQVNGVPVVNPNGKYCIKLWHSGKERLIEIDHKIPISFEGDPILPYAQNKALWATLLCKAYLKLYSYRWERIGKQLQTEDDEFDGSFMYALTGFYPISFSFNNQENQARQWQIIRYHLMDKDWESVNNMVIAYCDVNFVPIIQSLVKKADNEESKTEEKSELQKSEQNEQVSLIQKESNFTFSQQQIMQEVGIQKRQSEAQFEQNTSLNISGEGTKIGLEESRGNIQQSPAVLTPSNVTLEDLQIESAKGKQATGITTRKTLAKHNAVAFLGQQMYVLPKGKQCYLIPGFCYLIFETFINESNFDMKQVKQEEEEKANKKTRPVSKEKKKKNTNFDQSPLTKASSIRKKSPNQRESQLSVSRGSGGTRMKSKQKKHRKKHEEKKEFTVYQLIRLINKIENVPLLNIPCPWSHSEIQEAQKRHLNREFYHKVEERKKAALRRLEYSDEDSDLDKSQELNPEELEAEMQKLKEPLKRIPGGYWMQFSDFPNVFQHFYILYNPVQYKFSLFIDNLWEPSINSFEFKPEYEIILIEPLQEQKEEEAQLISPRALKSSQSPQPVIELLILFMPQLLDNFVIDTKSVRFKLQEFNVLDDSLIQEICNIQSTSISGQIIKLPKQNFILRPFTVGCPYGYSALIVSKNCKLSSMSKFQYLEEKLN